MDGHTVEIVPVRVAYAFGADQKPARAVQFVATDGFAPEITYSGGMKHRRTKWLSRIETMTEPGVLMISATRGISVNFAGETRA